jgi:small subunit ribosomal protein S13
MLNIEEINLFMINKTKLGSLEKIHGISSSSLLALKQKTGINYRLKEVFLKDFQLANSKIFLLAFKTDKKLKIETKESISFLKKLKSFKGTRHKLGYPCRGQRTHTNAKTAKKLKR